MSGKKKRIIALVSKPKTTESQKRAFECYSAKKILERSENHNLQPGKGTKKWGEVREKRAIFLWKCRKRKGNIFPPRSLVHIFIALSFTSLSLCAKHRQTAVSLHWRFYWCYPRPSCREIAIKRCKKNKRGKRQQIKHFGSYARHLRGDHGWEIHSSCFTFTGSVLYPSVSGILGGGYRSFLFLLSVFLNPSKRFLFRLSDFSPILCRSNFLSPVCSTFSVVFDESQTFI